LTEIDFNASSTSKRRKTNPSLSEKPNEKDSSRSRNRAVAEDIHITGTEERKESFEYKTKDNSKLRRFLSERSLSTSGTRDDLIARLSESSVNYEALSSEQLSAMLKQRHISNYATGSKATKIERLRLNDELRRDTGTSEDSILYGTFSVLQDIVRDQEKLIPLGDYSSKKATALSTILTSRRLTCSGSRVAKIARLQKDDRNKREKLKREYDTTKRKLEEATGRVGSECNRKDEDEHRAADYRIEKVAKDSRPGVPICDYEWQDSRWASRTERELLEICTRRDFPGVGPKAAMIKWLDTGSVDYEDLYAFSLERICTNRGLPAKSGEKKADLVRTLKEADEAEAVANRARYRWQDSVWASKTDSELAKICSKKGMPGSGPKASKVKWLDTGILEYEDEDLVSLKMKCMERGIHLTSKSKRLDIAARLREADKEKEESEIK